MVAVEEKIEQKNRSWAAWVQKTSQSKIKFRSKYYWNAKVNRSNERSCEKTEQRVSNQKNTILEGKRLDQPLAWKFDERTEQINGLIKILKRSYEWVKINLQTKDWISLGTVIIIEIVECGLENRAWKRYRLKLKLSITS